MAENGKLDLAQEAPGKAVQVADGFWIVASEHHPGGSKRMPQINNRALVFKLDDGGTPVLLVMNGIDDDGIAAVKSIEQETGLTVKYVVSPGGGHHVLMPAWQAAFAEAEIVVPGARVPRTASGAKLMALDRVRAMDAADPFPQFAGQLDFVVFDGLFSAPDAQTPGEGGSDSLFAMMGSMMAMMFKMKDPIEEIWVHHGATSTVIGGENLGWMYPAADHGKLPGMMKGMVQPDAVYIFDQPRKVADASTVSANWKRVLDWKADNVMTYHDVPTHASLGGGEAKLRDAVEKVSQL